jgi:hypothetical protein
VKFPLSGVGKEFDRLGDVAVGGGGADAETGREPGAGIAIAEVGESQQGLPACAQAPPSGAESAAVWSQAGGEEAKGRAGRVDAGRVDADTETVGFNPYSHVLGRRISQVPLFVIRTRINE